MRDRGGLRRDTSHGAAEMLDDDMSLRSRSGAEVLHDGFNRRLRNARQEAGFPMVAHAAWVEILDDAL